jgi:hypothetical protein
MADILLEVEDSLVKFVRERIPLNEWRSMNSSGRVLDALDEDSENELKDHFWNQLISSVRWFSVLDEIDRMRQNVLGDTESESESESELENESDSSE